MNINEAKTQIKQAMTAYFTKDALGNYAIPLQKQRPVFLMGPPGIGKTAIMEQIAEEMDVALVSYSMTHHTRQSALGLPFIVHKNYEGMECDVSEYTMSEIISSVYDMMEKSGKKKGILFLDEINCVSETLAPIMLQFLQYKVFGRHQVPDGWVVVTAGNPPEYNNSVREYDIATWDRLKRMDVTPDFDCWKDYAINKGLHPAILTYLETKRSDFYRIETTVDGKTFVTARGWDDLSAIIRLYEQHHFEVNQQLIGQYLQNPKIARSFSIYYDLFMKYRSDYQIPAILDGKASAEIIERAKEARFDERLSLMGLLLDAIRQTIQDVMTTESELLLLQATLREFKKNTQKSTGRKTPADHLHALLDKRQKELQFGKEAGSLSIEKQNELFQVIQILEDIEEKIKTETDPNAAFKIVKKIFDAKAKALKKDAKTAGTKLSHVFQFSEQAFDQGQELLILVTELTISQVCSRFISHYGCPEYFRHNKELLFFERHQEIIGQIEAMDL